MTSPDPFRSSLDAIAQAEFFEGDSQDIVEDWEMEGVGFEAVGPVLAFMEDHPTIDYGSPGPLTHFIEQFHGRGYDEALLASVQRRPTAHTIWLLNRLINSDRDDAVKVAHIAIMRDVASCPTVNDDARSAAAGFLKRLDG